ncbi:MAG: hypothetical protein JXA61_07450 [Bacteroidales bacterium]|nr:hypothetical protein [Bacteroidales bacterium]
MLLKYFNSNRLSGIALIPILVILFWLPEFFSPLDTSAAEYASSGVFGKYIISLNEDFTVLAAISAMIILIINGFMLLQLNGIYFFINSRTQLPVLVYILLCSAFPLRIRFTPALISSFLLILLLFRVFAAYKKEHLSYNFFDAGLLISLASLFYIPSILFYPFLLITMYILRPFVWREWVFTFAGLLLPYLFFFSAYILTDADIAEIIRGMLDVFTTGQTSDPGVGIIVFSGYIALLILISSLRLILVFDNIKIQHRKIYVSFFWMFLISLSIYFSIPACGVEMIAFTAIPVSFLLAFSFAHCRQNWINDLLLFNIFAGLIALKIIDKV